MQTPDTGQHTEEKGEILCDGKQDPLNLYSPTTKHRFL